MRSTRWLSLPLLLLLLVSLTVAPAFAGRGDDGDRTSKNGMAHGKIDGVDVKIEYGRPNVKGREIWGGLVPHGEVWRTGANEATTITFESDVEIEGKTLAAGTYAFFTIPNKDSWTLIFNKVADQWGAYDHDAKEDALRVDVEPAANDHTESLEFAIEGSQIVLRWEKVAVPFSIGRRTG